MGEKATKQQTKINALTLENERIKVDLTRMENLVNELQGIKHEQSKDRQDKEDLQAEIRKLKAENESTRSSKLKYQEKIKIVENDKRKVDQDNAKLRVAFRKQQDRTVELERDIRETMIELEMFEEMSKNIPKFDDSVSDLSDLDPPSPIQSKYYPSAGHAVSQPLTSSTPMMNRAPKSKLFMTTNL